MAVIIRPVDSPTELMVKPQPGPARLDFARRLAAIIRGHGVPEWSTAAHDAIRANDSQSAITRRLGSAGAAAGCRANPRAGVADGDGSQHATTRQTAAEMSDAVSNPAENRAAWR
jgi:hypothetical protein